MKKKLSQTAQIQLLKRLRRMCPFAVFSGSYGYTCGGMVGGGTFFFRHGRSSKEARHCMLSCADLRKQAYIHGYDITISKHTINAYG